jgi:restriction system protein
MAIPDYQTLMLPVLQLGSEGEQRVADVVDLLADRLGLTDAERQKLLPSGRQRVLHNRIHWAKFYLTKAGFLSSPGRGRFSTTQLGKEVLADKPARIDVSVLMKQPAFREFYRNESDAVSNTPGPALIPARTSPQRPLKSKLKQPTRPLKILSAPTCLIGLQRTARHSLNN